MTPARRLEALLPFLAWPRRMTGATLRADAFAGLAGALVVLPQSIALAAIAGMPPQYGLYASLVPAIVAALFGSSWHLVAGPSTTASLVLFASLSAIAPAGSPTYIEDAITLAIMAGVIELTLGVFRLGALVNFISNTVVVGYTAGVGALIIATQARQVFGLDIPRAHLFVDALRTTVVALPHASLPVTAVALVTIATGLAARKLAPKFPHMIPAIVVGSLAGAAANALAPGSVSTIGALPNPLPPLSAPSFDPAVWSLLAPTALAIAISALNEVTSIGRALAIRSEQHLDINQEFIGQGLANIVGSFFSAYVVSGSFNRSALNYESGARTPLAAVLSAAFLAAILIVAAPLAAYLPHAAMAASLVLIGWSLIDVRNLKRIWEAGWSERGVLLATLSVALFMHIQAAILAGVALSLIVYLYRTSNPRLTPRAPNPDDPRRKFFDAGGETPECPQLRLARLEGSLYFGAVNAFRDALAAFERERPDCRRFGILMRGVNFIDFAGAEALAVEARRLKAHGGGLYLINVKERPRHFLAEHGYADEIGHDHIFVSKGKALAEIFARLDPDICKTCRARIFNECAGVPVS